MVLANACGPCIGTLSHFLYPFARIPGYFLVLHGCSCFELLAKLSSPHFRIKLQRTLANFLRSMVQSPSKSL